MGQHTTSMQETLQKRICAIQRQRRNISNNQKRNRKMKTIICKFKSDGKEVSKTAIINDSLDTLSISKKSEATDIIEPDTFDYEEWSIYFEVTDTLAYEIVFEYDQESHIKTLKPIKAITWDGTDIDHVVITDVQKVSVTIR